jgi:hypothetical protein
VYIGGRLGPVRRAGKGRFPRDPAFPCAGSTGRSAFLKWQFACLHREDRLAGAPLFATFTYPLISEE